MINAAGIGEEREGRGWEGKGGKRRGERGRGRGKRGRGWPDQSQTRCYGSEIPPLCVGYFKIEVLSRYPQV